MPKVPCNGCPDRWSECHAHCEKYAEYEQARNAEYAEWHKAAEQARILNEIEWQRKLKFEKAKGGRKRNGK